MQIIRSDGDHLLLCIFS